MSTVFYAQFTRRILGVVLALILLPGLVSAGTMTFSNLLTGSFSYDEDGLRVTSNAAMYLYTGGGNSMYPSTNWQTMTLTLEAGGPFTLTSIDMSERYTGPGQTAVFVGTLTGGGTVTTTITTDSIPGFETILFPASFTDLTSVSWDETDPDANCWYDNIVAMPDIPVSTETLLATFTLRQNVPNPFNPVTGISFEVPDGGANLSLRIYDASGRLIRTLVDGYESSGTKAVSWDGRNDQGQPVASGTYFYQLTAPSFSETRKMVLLK